MIVVKPEYVDGTLLRIGDGWYLGKARRPEMKGLWLVLHACSEPMSDEVGVMAEGEPLECRTCRTQANESLLPRANWHARRLGGTTVWDVL